MTNTQLPKEVQEQNPPNDAHFDKAAELRKALWEHLISNPQIIDDPYLFTNGKVYTRRELSYEVNFGTPVGIEIITKMLLLSLDLMARDKVPPSYQSLQADNLRLRQALDGFAEWMAGHNDWPYGNPSQLVQEYLKSTDEKEGS